MRPAAMSGVAKAIVASNSAVAAFITAHASHRSSEVELRGPCAWRVEDTPMWARHPTTTLTAEGAEGAEVEKLDVGLLSFLGVLGALGG